MPKLKYKINQYDGVRLKNGNYAVIVEVLKDNDAFIADIEVAEDEYNTDTIFYRDIASLIMKVEVPLAS
ncbi:MAG: hypothetical protein LBE35_10360 [Clostridiales bacterium]|jgi:hypothetical protein|nr:hypothetical protein [Clostridiales bacterium]